MSKEYLEAFERLNNDNSDYALKRALKDIDIVGQALIKTQEQEKVLEIINKKNVDICLLKRSENWLDYYTRFKHRTAKNTEITEEEFKLLKRYFNE